MSSNLLLTNYTIYVIILLYLIPTTIFFLIMDDDSISSLSNLSRYSGKTITKTVVILFFLNLAGLPPLPGFFLKLNLFVFFFKKCNLWVSLILVLFNYTSFYLYVSSLKSTFSGKKTRNSVNFSEKKVKLCFIFLYFSLGFILAQPHLVLSLISSVI